MKEKTIALSVSLEDLNKILSGLGHLPYARVYELIGDLRLQTEKQLETFHPVPPGQQN